MRIKTATFYFYLYQDTARTITTWSDTSSDWRWVRKVGIYLFIIFIFCLACLSSFAIPHTDFHSQLPTCVDSEEATKKKHTRFLPVICLGVFFFLDVFLRVHLRPPLRPIIIGTWGWIRSSFHQQVHCSNRHKQSVSNVSNCAITARFFNNHLFSLPRMVQRCTQQLKSQLKISTRFLFFERLRKIPSLELTPYYFFFFFIHVFVSCGSVTTLFINYGALGNPASSCGLRMVCMASINVHHRQPTLLLYSAYSTGMKSKQ